MSGSTHILHMLPEIAAEVAYTACADAFCVKLADYAGAELIAVKSFYDMLNPNIWGLVQSPQGWATLARLMIGDPEHPLPVLASVH